jgi:hypothetical protein
LHCPNSGYTIHFFQDSATHLKRHDKTATSPVRDEHQGRKIDIE